MPSLRSRGEAIAGRLTWRALWPDAPEDESFPVVVYGHDTSEAFGAFPAGYAGELDELHEQAVTNLARQEVSVDKVEVEGIGLIAVSGNFYAAEKLLDRAFMRGLHRRFDHDILAASVPRRGLMFVAAVERSDKRELLVMQAATQREARTTRAVSEAILLIKDGEVAGHVMISPGPRRDDPDADASKSGASTASADGDRHGDPDASDEPAPAPVKKPGWLRRLFGRKK